MSSSPRDPGLCLGRPKRKPAAWRPKQRKAKPQTQPSVSISARGDLPNHTLGAHCRRTRSFLTQETRYPEALLRRYGLLFRVGAPPSSKCCLPIQNGVRGSTDRLHWKSIPFQRRRRPLILFKLRQGGHVSAHREEYPAGCCR